MKDAHNIPLIRSDFSQEQISQLFEGQRDFFKMGKSRELSFRIEQLKKLKKVIQENEEAILDALALDMSKPRFEAYSSEIGFVYAEINHCLKNLKSWAKPKKVGSPIFSFPSKSYILPEAKGVCLIIGPWNYPFQLVIGPLIAAISAGNTAFIKPPEQCPNTSNLVAEILSANFDQELVCVVQGEGKKVVPQLMNNFRFDHVFFTGSVPVGKIVGEMAAKKMVPCTLELGGKSPCVIDKSANFKVAADRIAFGKWLNAGQTCVAPDYLLVERQAWDEFREALESTIKRFYPEGALNSDSYASLINKDRFRTIESYLSQGEIIFGGEKDPDNLRIAPTLILHPNLESPIMEEEIFGPVLPILLYDFKEDAQAVIAQNPNPLAFYVFSENRKEQEYWQNSVSFGNGCINNTVIHLANTDLPFGGIGSSGMGNYHGKFGFDTFSHHKAIMKSANWLDPKEKYPPYSNFAYRIIHWIMS